MLIHSDRFGLHVGAAAPLAGTLEPVVEYRGGL